MKNQKFDEILLILARISWFWSKFLKFPILFNHEQGADDADDTVDVDDRGRVVIDRGAAEVGLETLN